MLYSLQGNGWTLCSPWLHWTSAPDQLLMVLLANPNPDLAQAAWQLQLAAVMCTWSLLSDYPRSGACRPNRLVMLEAAMGAASTGQRVVGRDERCRDTVLESRVRGML